MPWQCLKTDDLLCNIKNNNKICLSSQVAISRGLDVFNDFI